MRVSLPISTVGRSSVRLSTRPTACARRSTKSGVMGAGPPCRGCRRCRNTSCSCLVSPGADCTGPPAWRPRPSVPPRSRARRAPARCARRARRPAAPPRRWGPCASRHRRRPCGAQRGLARPAGQQRIAGVPAVALARQQREILRHGLAEADARVPRCGPIDATRAQGLACARAGSAAPAAPRRLPGAALHGLRLAVHVHQADAAGVLPRPRRRAPACAAPRCR
jgi:hypothetical protein